jgi:DNA-binding response OmpR family regulator
MTKRVLIAEDEESIVASLEFLMRQCGYRTHVARDGESAVRSLDAFQPDLVLLDVMLPLRSGYEVCRAIRSDDRLRSTRVLMLTARGAAADEARGMAAGADAYLTKPFATRELVARARELLGDPPK